MRAMGSFPRIAIVMDDDLRRERLADHVGGATRPVVVPGGTELVNLAVAHAIDVAIVGVLNRNDDFLPSALRELTRITPDVSIVGVFEPSRPSLDEAAALAREIPGMGFVRGPGARLDYLVRRRQAEGKPGTLTPLLLDCMDRLPLFGVAKAFALLQALHPSCAFGIPEQARELGTSRRNLERWFQGPDLCSAGCFQSVCGAAEAAYLRLVCGLREREIAPVVGILTRDGVENPLAVPRTIRSALRLGLDELRPGGVPVLVSSVEAALRTSHDPVKSPAQWEPNTRCVPQPGVLAVPVEGRLIIVDPTRGVEYPLDAFGMDAWPFVSRGASFATIVANLTLMRREPPHALRARLIFWLGELLVLRLVRREQGSVEAANGL